LGSTATLPLLPIPLEILRQGYMNRDLFVLLEGALSVHIDGVQRRTLGPSSVLGEVAFFGPGGGRSASVRSVGRCRLLHLRPSALRDLAHRRPAEGLQVYAELARVLAERLSSATPGHSASADAIGDSTKRADQRVGLSPSASLRRC
jgi:CRP-like cAMP-binding protein